MFKETEVSFKAGDGWLIHGTLSVPTLASSESVPGAILIPSPSHDRDVYGHNGYPSLRANIEKESIGTLRIDLRGRGRSFEPQEYHRLTEEQRARVSLDVSGALEFLSQQEEIDADRLGVIAEAASAEAATLAAVEDTRVSALVLLSGRMGQAAKESVGARADLPVLCVVSQEDKISLVDMTDVYKLSQHPETDIFIHRDLGIGNPMFSMWAAKYPQEKPLESCVATWLADRLSDSSQSKEVSFSTGDGWTIFGSLRLPHSAKSQSAPGVVLVHSNLSDRHVFDGLERRLAAAGFAVLNIDFRGKGKSQNKGSYFAMSLEERDKGYLDVLSAMEFLSTYKGIDANEISIVATSVGVKYGVKAACVNAKVRSLVVLGGLPDSNEIKNANFPVLFVSNQGVPQIAEAFRECYRVSKNRRSQILKYEGGAVGYQLFHIDPKLEPYIVTWLKSQSTKPF
jgi:dienelactone hydrolase